MSEVLQSLDGVLDSISSMIDSIDKETTKDLVFTGLTGVIGGIVARSRDLKKILGKQAVVHTTAIVTSLMVAYYLTESPVCSALSMVPYVITYYFPSSQSQGNDDDYQLKR